MRTFVWGAGAVLGMAAAAAWGGASKPLGSGTLLNCPTSGTSCKVSVTVSTASLAQNDCGVKVVDEVHFKKNIKRLAWVVGTAGPVTNVTFRFNPADGVAIDDNTSGSQPVFAPEAISSADTYAHGVLQAVVKTFPYTLKLQWKKTGDPGWTDCKPYDPIIANEG